ncbi:MAG TPA: fluoride efflux transporter CrcB [Pyrinomonadaceae bacterium]|nr:fluoride efflux transporter CrcB [Pyrinomonadaceae bacterium]
MDTLTKYLAVAAGSALGGMLRYALGSTILSRTAAPFPAATFVINVTGSFIVGFFLTLATERLQMSAHLRLAVAVGFVGAYTTFSTFEYETLRLAEERHVQLALLNVFLSVVVGFAAVWGGAWLARKFEPTAAHAHGRAGLELFARQAVARDPAEVAGAPTPPQPQPERDIRDATIAAPPRDV